MKNRKTDNDIRTVAKEAIDPGALARVLEAASGEASDDETAEALQEVTADLTLILAARAASRARHRARTPTPEDVAQSYEHLCGRCDDGPEISPLHLTVWES